MANYEQLCTEFDISPLPGVLYSRVGVLLETRREDGMGRVLTVRLELGDERVPRQDGHELV